jgi:excisionase family DNA binding protein
MTRARRPEDVALELEQIREQLQAEGQDALANRLERSIADLRDSAISPMPSGGVMTTGEAAAELGVRSVNTIKRWAAEGFLEGFRRGGRILVSRRSVERLRDNSALHAQRDWESGLQDALAPFDAGEEELPPSDATTLGRKPWQHNGSPRASHRAASH